MASLALDMRLATAKLGTIDITDDESKLIYDAFTGLVATPTQKEPEAMADVAMREESQKLAELVSNFGVLKLAASGIVDGVLDGLHDKRDSRAVLASLHVVRALKEVVGRQVRIGIAGLQSHSYFFLI